MGYVQSSPVVGANGTVYFGSMDGVFYAVHE
jgi:outer membrane protein assembly factor BamB